MAAVAGSVERLTDLQTTTTSSTTSCTLTYPRAPKTGELLVVGITSNGAGGGGIITPSGWQQLSTNIYAAGARQVTAFYRRADGTEGASVQFAHTGSPNQWCAFLTGYSGIRQYSLGSIINDAAFGGEYSAAGGISNGSGTICTLSSSFAAPTRGPRVGVAAVATNAVWASGGTPTINAGGATSATLVSSVDFSTTMSLAFIEIVNAPTATSSTPPTVTFATSRTHSSGGFVIPSENSRTMLLGVG
jgi:hypothetical protein